MGAPPYVPAIFTREDNFWDFLFTLLDSEIKRVLFLKEKNAAKIVITVFPSKKVKFKKVHVELHLLKLYPFKLERYPFKLERSCYLKL